MIETVDAAIGTLRETMERLGVWERTHVVFESLTDVGGAIPAWLVNRLYRFQVLGQFEDLRRKLDALQALQESTP